MDAVGLVVNVQSICSSQLQLFRNVYEVCVGSCPLWRRWDMYFMYMWRCLLYMFYNHCKTFLKANLGNVNRSSCSFSLSAIKRILLAHSLCTLWQCVLLAHLSATYIHNCVPAPLHKALAPLLLGCRGFRYVEWSMWPSPGIRSCCHIG